MPIALAVALAAAWLPPVTIIVNASPTISAALVKQTIEEADAVWKGSGIRFAWRVAAREADRRLRPAAADPYGPETLRVTIDEAAGERKEWDLPIGWIVFDAPDTPRPEIHISHENALTLLTRYAGSRTSTMPEVEVRTLLGRGMGRALAHELGHFLLASKVHTATGLMRARRSAFDLFGFERSSWALDATERELAVQRLMESATAHAFTMAGDVPQECAPLCGSGG